MNTLETAFHNLLQSIQTIPAVCAIGKTGGAALPKDGCSDIDLFVFCETIPSLREREQSLATLHESVTVVEFDAREHPHWGLVDSMLIGEQEIYLMFFTKRVFAESVASILCGERTEREENYFYPTGRCASVLGMHSFYDPKGFLYGLQQQCMVYPDELRDALLAAHLPKINDHEDFQRAILRNDVLFYHATLDLALDHFLQALFALNRVYFPSRKRSLELIRDFTVMPEDCESRILRVIELGVNVEMLAESYRLWQALCRDIEPA
jgi:hypothetical protein